MKGRRGKIQGHLGPVGVLGPVLSVQAEYEIFATPTFLDPFDLRKLLAGHFFPSGIVFTYPQGPLALGS